MDIGRNNNCGGSAVYQPIIIPEHNSGCDDQWVNTCEVLWEKIITDE